MTENLLLLLLCDYNVYIFLVPTSKSKAGPEELAEGEEQSQSHQHVCPVSYQIPCWYNNLTNGKVMSH